MSARADAPPESGVRWPAEWEPHAATWLAWPKLETTWPGHLAAAQAEFAAFVRELSFREPVALLVDDETMADLALARIRDAGADERVTPRVVPTDDAWLRDSGPIFVASAGDGAPLLLDFPFDAWGGKYPPWDRDAAVPRAIATLTGHALRRAPFVLEGGSVDGNGAGTMLTTESCLLNENRERGRTREQMEERLGNWLGARSVIWLADGIEGDDTDGHIDDIARFVAEDTVVTAMSAQVGSADHAKLAENADRLRAAHTADGRRLAVVELPMPDALRIDGQVCPASHANFYIANGCVLVPTFGGASDARALAILRELFAGREVVGVPSATLVLGLGALHCLSQQEPA